MPKIIKKLTEQEIRNAPIKKKPYRLCDEGGLRLLIRPSGTKVWQYPYKINGRSNVYTIGQYFYEDRPGYIRTQAARKKRDEIKALIQQGIDPNKYKKAKASNLNEESETTFEAIAREWHAKGVWVPKHAKNILKSLEEDIFSLIGKKQIEEINTPDIIAVISAVEDRGALDVAKRVCQRCEAIFDYAMVKGLCDNNPAAGRGKFIKYRKPKHRPHLKEGEVGEFLHKLDDYHGKDYIRLAMKLLALTFVRPGELRHAQWKEIDRDKPLWIIPAERMKMSRDHAVPLSTQSLEILDELEAISGKGDYLFPGLRSPHKPISDVTLLKLLKIMGYEGKRKITPHGFRHTASTILNEYRFDRDVIERQLAHVEKNKVRRTYNHAEYLDERHKMMQWYADHLEKMQQAYEYESEKSRTNQKVS